MDMAEVAADLRTKPVMPVPTCSCKYVSLLELSVTIVCKNTHVCHELATQTSSYLHFPFE